MSIVTLDKLVEKMQLKNLTPNIDITAIELKVYDVNRPALQLSGFFDYFDMHRMQIIGHVEHTFIERRLENHGINEIREIMAHGVPCIVYCRGIDVADDIIKAGNEYGVPVISTTETTSAFMAEVIRWLRV